MTALFLVGCDQAPQPHESTQQTIETEQNQSPVETENRPDHQVQERNLSQGNLFNIAGDIARLQIQTDEYVNLIKQTQNQLTQAVQDKNTQQLQHSTNTLRQELQGLHDRLRATSLKSQEVDQIRQNLITANQQILNMPLLHEQLDLSKVDIEKIEKQLNRLQMDMLQLATLILGNNATTEQAAS